jgi:hypothetical protein
LLFPPVVSSGPFETFRFRDPFKASLQNGAFFLANSGVIKLMTKTYKNQQLTVRFGLQKRKLARACGFHYSAPSRPLLRLLWAAGIAFGANRQRLAGFQHLGRRHLCHQSLEGKKAHLKLATLWAGSVGKESPDRGAGAVVVFLEPAVG